MITRNTIIVVLGMALAAGSAVAANSNAVIELTLKDAITIVLSNNPEVESARLDWGIARKGLLAAYAPYQPSVVGRTSKGELEKQNDLTEQINRGVSLYQETKSSSSAGLEGQLPGGATYRFGWSIDDTANNMSSTYLGYGRMMASVNDEGKLRTPEHILRSRPMGEFMHEFDTFVGVSVEQPLLKNSWSGSAISAIRAARADTSAAFHNYRKQLMSVVLKVEAAYWNLVYMQERYAMDGDSVDIASKLVTDAEQRVSAGKMSDLERVQAAAGLASRSSEREQTYQDYLDAMIRLKLLLADSGISRLQVIKAVDPLVAPAKVSDTLAADMVKAFEWACIAQPDFLVRGAELARENVRADYFRNQRLPQVNITGSWGLTGWGEEQSEAMRNLQEEGHTDWTVGLEVKVPLGPGLKEFSDLSSAVMRRDQARKNLSAIENEIIASLVTVERQLKSFGRQVNNAEMVIDFTRSVLDAELSKLDLGKSTMREVYQAEEDLAQSRRKKIENLIRYREALMSLSFVSASVLRDIDLESLKKNRLILSEVVDPHGWSDDVSPVDRLSQTDWERQNRTELRTKGPLPEGAQEDAPMKPRQKLEDSALKKLIEPEVVKPAGGAPGYVVVRPEGDGAGK